MKLRALLVVMPATPSIPAPAPSVVEPTPAPIAPAVVPAVPPPLAVAWAKVAESSPNYIDAVAVRADGSILVAGSDDGRGWSAKPGPRKPTANGAVVSLPAHAFGDSDAFVAELDARGAPRWVATGGSSEHDDARSVAIAGAAIYVTGQFGGAATFGDHQLALAVGAAPRVANPSNVYVARYGPSGDLAWATSYGVAESFDQGWAMTGLSDDGSMPAAC